MNFIASPFMFCLITKKLGSWNTHTKRKLTEHSQMKSAMTPELTPVPRSQDIASYYLEQTIFFNMDKHRRFSSKKIH